MTEIENLRKENERLVAENTYLKKLLDNHGISYEYEHKQTEIVDTKSEINRRIKLFMKLFCARTEFYAERWENKAGRSGYAPACSNRWKDICPKKKDKNVKCYECEKSAWVPFTEDIAYKHLVGKDERGRPFVVGTYTLLADSSCKFLVFDFDDHDGSRMVWKEEAKLLREICQKYGIDTALERSRSGNGAHVWIFFEEPIPAKLARKFGALLLAKGAEIMHQKDFNTFDRMMPNQDEMPIGGMGNLIALPLQGIPRKEGNSAFVDDDWNVISNQWEYLEQRKLLSKEFVMSKLSEWNAQNEPVVLESEDDESDGKPWEKKKTLKFEKEDISKPLILTLSDCIYIPKDAIKPRTMNRIRKIATFSNPQFYKMQAMRYSTKQMPRYIQCFRDFEKFVALPRGCLKELEEKLQDAEIQYTIDDCRNYGRNINVSFNGNLQLEQEKAANIMLKHDIGIIGAATGFGKTVLGTYLIAARKVNTLILVHNREIMREWQESIEKFLQISEEIPILDGKRQRKAKSVVGTLYSAHDSLHGIVDIAMISSLGRNDNVDERVGDYGMVIMDECHHAGAYTFENVLWKVKAKYVYGLTATPMREDGHEKIMFMQLGEVRYRLTEKERAVTQDFRHEIAPRFTAFAPITQSKPTINDLYKLLVCDKNRNKMIVEDILDVVDKGRTPLVLTKFKEHVEIIFKSLQEKHISVILLMGGGSTKERKARRENLLNVANEEKLVIIATGKYIGEGFNFPRLDTLFLTMPISWKGNIAQYAGRLHRDFEGKENVIIYDYVDVHVKMLEKMYQKRLNAYSSMGYTIFAPTGDSGCNIIYTIKDYQDMFWKDIREADKSVYISSPRLSRQRVLDFKNRLTELKNTQTDFVIWTLPTVEYSENQRKGIESMKKMLRDNGIEIKDYGNLNCHFAVIDNDLVWYGSMNFLSREHDDDILMRIRSEEIVCELLAMIK